METSLRGPNGSALACLSSKLARGTLRVIEHGRELVLHTKQAALEIGTRAPGHGIVILASLDREHAS